MLARGLFLRQYLRWCASKASKLSSTDCGHVALDAGEVYNDALFAARARCLIVRRSVWVRHQLRRRDRVVCVVAEMHDCLVPAGPKRKRKRNALRQKYFCEIASSVSSRAGLAKTITAKKKTSFLCVRICTFVLVKQVN